MNFIRPAILFLAIASFAPDAFGQAGQVTWTGDANDDNFETALNWTSATGAVVPNASSDVLIEFNSTINQTTATQSIQNLTVNSPFGFVFFGFTGITNTTEDTINLNIGTGHTLTIVGSTPGSPLGNSNIDTGATLNLNGGTLIMNQGILTVGDANGPGTLNLQSGVLNYDVQTAGNNTQLTIGAGTNGLADTFGQGVFTQSGTSTVITGQDLFIGSNGGNGTYNLTGSSTLDLGTPGGPKLGTGANLYDLGIGNNQYDGTTALGQGSVGNLDISGSSILNVSPEAQVRLGDAINTIGGQQGVSPTGFTGGTGSITQSGGTVNFQANTTAGSSLILGSFTGGVGNYNLDAGTLNLTGTAAQAVTMEIGGVAGSVGTLSQNGGTFNANIDTAIAIGFNGLGIYNLAGGSATLLDGFNLGGLSTTGTGIVNQTGGTLVTGTTTAPGSGVLIGGATGSATGTFNLGGGTATFNGGVTLDATGTFTQTGGTFIVPTGQSLTVNTGGLLALNGGTLQVGAANLLSPGGGGILNFGGGTLQFTSGTTFTDPFTSGHTLTGNTVSIINATLPGFTSVTMAGLTGGGGIEFIGTDNVTTFHFMAGANSYTGGTTIFSGTLNTSTANILNSSSLNIGPSDTLATLNLGVTTTPVIYPGTLSGEGILNIVFSNTANTLSLTNSSSFTGSITLSATVNPINPGNPDTGGTLQVFNGSFTNISDVAAHPGSLVIGQIAGTNPFAPNTGIVTLGNAAYHGTTLIDPNFTLVAPSIIGTGAVTNNGTLMTANIGGSLTDGVGSILTPTGPLTVGTSSLIGGVPVFTSGPTLTVGGNFSSSGTINIRLNGVDSDLINALGPADTITATTFVNLINGVGMRNYVILKTPAPGDLTSPASVSTNAPTALFSATVTPDATKQYLIVNTFQKQLLPFTTTPNQAAVANALDPFVNTPPQALLPILIALDKLPVGTTSIGPFLDQLSPEVLQYSRSISFENSTFLAQRVDGALADVRNGATGLDTDGIGVITPGFESGLGRSLGSLLAYSPFHSTAPNGVNYYPEGDDSSNTYPSSAPLSPRASSSPASDTSGETISDSPIQLKTSSEAPVLRAPQWNGFFAGDVVLADLNQSQSVNNAAPAKANYTSGDALAGVNFRITSNLTAGVLMDYNHTNASTDSNGSKTTVDTYSPGIYGSYSSHSFYANALFAFGLNNYSNTRNISFLGSTATSSPTGQQYVSNLDFGYDFHPDPKWIVGPTLGVTYTHLDIDSFTETGAGPADLMVSSQNIDSLRSRLGGHLVYQTHTGNVLFQPNLSIMWQHEYLDDNNGITSQFSIPGTGPFTIQAASATKDSALIGCGVTATLDNSMALYLNYMADIGVNDYFVQTVMGGFKASF